MTAYPTITIVTGLEQMLAVQETMTGLEPLRLGKFKPGKEQLERWYHGERKSLKAMATLCGFSQTTMGNWLTKEGISRRSKSRIGKDSYKPGEEELRRLYLEERKSTLEIGQQCKVSHGTIRRWLKEYNIPIRGIAEANKTPGKELPSKEKLIQLYHKEKRTLTEIGETFGVHHSAVSRQMEEYGIPRRTAQEAQSLRRESPPSEEKRRQSYSQRGIYFPQAAELRQWYHEERRQVRDIAEHCGVSLPTLYGWLKYFNIPSRKSFPRRAKARREDLEAMVSSYIQKVAEGYEEDLKTYNKNIWEEKQ